jgi:hypothetical protein
MNNEKINKTFKSDIKNKIDGKWISIGQVNSTYLKIDDEYVINPLTGNPYIVPVGYDPQNTIENFIKYDQKNQVFQELYQYKTSGSLDLQRGFNGEIFGGFVADYTPIASFDFGLAVSAGGLSVTMGEIGGGIINAKNVIEAYLEKKHKIPESNGDFFNNPANIPNIEKGYSAYKNDSFRLLDIVREQIKTDANWFANQDLSKDVADIFNGAITSLSDGITGATNSSEWENHFNELFPALAMFRFGSINNQVLDTIKNIVNSAKSTSSPIILDLNKNGIETTGVKQGAYFDHSGDGFSEQTAWIGSGDGLLVRDINNNGRIENGKELFGNETLLPNGNKAANGFDALKALDSNGDNQINVNDAVFASSLTYYLAA